MMKPCGHEQNLLLAIHHEGGPWIRAATAWHCLFCAACRQRRTEFLMASRALLALRPAHAFALPAAPLRRRRLILCSALVALAAAAVSYYVSFGAAYPGTDRSGLLPNAGTASVRCGPDEDGKSGKGGPPPTVAQASPKRL